MRFGRSRDKSDLYPLFTGRSLRVGVQPQLFYGRPPDGRQPNDGSLLHIQAEMAFPIIAARVKQGNLLTAFPVDRHQGVTLEQIAGSASEGAIPFVVLSATAGRHHMLDFERKLKIASGAWQYSQRCPARAATSW
jgi:hypothetical protein